jgi:hypothetical protein
MLNQKSISRIIKGLNYGKNNRNKVKFPRKKVERRINNTGTFDYLGKYIGATLMSEGAYPDKVIDRNTIVYFTSKESMKCYENNFRDRVPVLLCENNYQGKRMHQKFYYILDLDFQYNTVTLKEYSFLNCISFENMRF